LTPETHAAEANLVHYRWFSAIVWTPFMLPILVLFWQDNGLDMFEVYLLQGLFAVAVVLLEVPTGVVADRLGKRASLIAACATLFVSMCGYALGTNFWHFLAAEIGAAVGAALVSGADSALLYDSLHKLGRETEYTRHEGRARGVQLVSFALATLLGGVIGDYDLRAAMWATVVGPFLAFFVALRFVEIAPPPASGDLRTGLRETGRLLREAAYFVRKHRLVRWNVGVLAALTGSASWLLWMYQPYMSFSGLPVWAFGVAFAIFNLGAAFASRVSHDFRERLGPRGALAALAGLQAMPPLLMATFIHPASFLFALGHQAVRGLGRPLITAEILRHTYADKRATVLSIASLCGRLFFALTAPLIGLVTERADIPTSLTVQSGLLIGIAVWLGWRYRGIPAKYFTVKPEVQEHS